MTLNSCKVYTISPPFTYWYVVVFHNINLNIIIIHGVKKEYVLAVLTEKVLAHGFFSSNEECLGIHFDKSENLYFGESRNPPDGLTIFYTVLLQEIRHELGIKHYVHNDSIMYAYYEGDIYKLTQDDMWTIQYLYTRPERLEYELIPTTTVKPTVSKGW